MDYSHRIPFGEGRFRLDEEGIQIAKQMRESGNTYELIAKHLGVSFQTIQRVTRNVYDGKSGMIKQRKYIAEPKKETEVFSADSVYCVEIVRVYRGSKSGLDYTVNRRTGQISVDGDGVIINISFEQCLSMINELTMINTNGDLKPMKLSDI